MPQLVVRTREGQELQVDAEADLSIMEAIRNAGVDELLTLCGGCCACATCHVYVDEAFVSRLPPMSEGESELLGGSGHRVATSRLSCQVLMNHSLDGLRVTIAPED
jgi:2Fe-2S ferredoxin